LASASALLSLDLFDNKMNIGCNPDWITWKEMADVHLADFGIDGFLRDWKPTTTSMFTSIDFSNNNLTREIRDIFKNMSQLGNMDSHHFVQPIKHACLVSICFHQIFVPSMVVYLQTSIGGALTVYHFLF
jgi:hypothetical protein